MGIDYAAAKKLVQLSGKTEQRGRVLLLGRSKFRVRPRLREALGRILEENGHSLRYGDLTQPDGYSENFFKVLGYSSVECLDLSDYEGATILHDLNEPVPEALHGQYDLVFDGGTTEHIFDVAICMGNLFALLAPNGILASCAPVSGWAGHGFYQFNPELVFGFWRVRMRCEVLHCSILPEFPTHPELLLSENIGNGRRFFLERHLPPGRSYLYYEVQKGPDARDGGTALQTDYVAKWAQADRDRGMEDSAMIQLRQHHLNSI